MIKSFSLILFFFLALFGTKHNLKLVNSLDSMRLKVCLHEFGNYITCENQFDTEEIHSSTR